MSPKTPFEVFRDKLCRALCWFGIHRWRLEIYTADGYVYECERCPDGFIERRDGTRVP